MSTRGINFLDEWIADNLPETAKPDVISIHDLTEQLLTDAGVARIRRIEIDEEVDSLYQTVLDAIVHREPGRPE